MFIFDLHYHLGIFSRFNKQKQTKVNMKATEFHKSLRNGAHATIYELVRDPKLHNRDRIAEGGDKRVFPFVEGSSYNGEWKDDMKHGFGTLIYPDGTKYEGDWSMNKRHGNGTLWIKEGKKSVKQYVGCWREGVMEGFGTFHYENGEVYKGEWVRNQREGNGRLEYPNGDFFVGEWVNNLQHGIGTFHLSNGNIFEGMYLNGKRDGAGKFFYASTLKVSLKSKFFHFHVLPIKEHLFVRSFLLFIRSFLLFIRSFSRSTRVSGYLINPSAESTASPPPMKCTGLVNQWSAKKCFLCRPCVSTNHVQCWTWPQRRRGNSELSVWAVLVVLHSLLLPLALQKLYLSVWTAMAPGCCRSGCWVTCFSSWASHSPQEICTKWRNNWTWATLPRFLSRKRST